MQLLAARGPRLPAGDTFVPQRQRTARRLWCTASAGAPDPYTVLQVPRGSSADAVRKAYVKLIRLSHPDVNPAEDTTAAATQLNLAYQTVMTGWSVHLRRQHCAAFLALLTMLAHAADLAANSGEAELDVFDRPDSPVTELFVNPFACGCNPAQWVELQEVARSCPHDPQGALQQAGAAPSESAIVYLTAEQLREVRAELEGMGLDAVSIEACASYLSNCLLRAGTANNRVPPPPLVLGRHICGRLSF